MKDLSRKDFFLKELEDHPDLWEGDEFVWRAIGRLNEYFQKIANYKIHIDLPKHVRIDKPEQIFIGEGTIIEPGVYIQGPCILGSGCIIRHGAYLRGGVLCGKKCIIGHASEVKHSILLEGVQVAHLAYVGDSILGSRVNLGAGVKCANLRLDRKEIVISFDEKKIPTGLKKFGCVLGDGCQIGCNSVLNPGTLMGAECSAYPLMNIYGVIPAHTRIKNKNGDAVLSPQETSLLERLR